MAIEIELIKASDVKMRRRGEDSDWGGWVQDGMELSYPAYSGGVYPIDLRRFTTSTEMLDMIMQVASKTWATDACIAGLVRALGYLLQPQGTLCNGEHKRLTTKQVENMVKTGSL